MVRHVLIAVVFVILNIDFSRGCQPRINSAAVAVITTTPTPTTAPTTTPTTTTTVAPCVLNTDQVVLFVQKDTVFVNNDYGMTAATSTCAECDTGSDLYYKPTTTAIPHSTAPLEGIGSITAADCPNLCICDSNDECYSAATANVVVTFWPYCSTTGCRVYVVLTGLDDTDGLVSTTTSKMYIPADQIDETFEYKAIPDASYLEAKTVGCTGCVTTTCAGRVA
uniref:Apple domain-containing protein n=1 Tax=Panagrellus redivivus TaxID=6233 RepID=A0A7E4VTQ6_PANRE